VRSLMHRHRDVGASRSAPDASPRRATAVVTPTLSFSGRPNPGLSVRVRF
jgi:hypothetical protein